MQRTYGQVRDLVLPIGYRDPQGRLHRHATIAKMRGHEEALLYDSSLTAPELVTELIRSCLVRLGELETVTSQMVSEFYTADRNFLLLELRRFTLGDLLRAYYLCSRCGHEISVHQDLGALPVRKLEDGEELAELSVELEDGYTDREGIRHVAITLGLPTGLDEAVVAPVAESDPLRAQDLLLLRCIRRFGSLSSHVLEGYGIKILRDLALGDRRRLQRALHDQAPGVDFGCLVRCDSCAASFQATLDVTSFFAVG